MLQITAAHGASRRLRLLPARMPRWLVLLSVWPTGTTKTAVAGDVMAAVVCCCTTAGRAATGGTPTGTAGMAGTGTMSQAAAGSGCAVSGFSDG